MITKNFTFKRLSKSNQKSLRETLIKPNRSVHAQKKILIIDDNEVDRYLIKKISQHTNMDVQFFEASSGEEGIACFSKISPDIVVLDTHLPQMDGFQVCRRIKNDTAVKAKVIMMTGQIDAVDTRKAREMGADDHCVKTADFMELMNSLKKII